MTKKEYSFIGTNNRQNKLIERIMMPFYIYLLEFLVKKGPKHNPFV